MSTVTDRYTSDLDVDFHIVHRDVALARGIENAAPVGCAAGDLAVLLGFALAADAHRGVGQGLQAGQRNAFAAAFAVAIFAAAHPFERSLDVGQLAAFHFGQLRAD